MEEINSLIFRGCKLARDLELNLHNNLENQPNTVLISCDEIVRIFTAARDRLSGSTSYGQIHEPQTAEVGGGAVEEWRGFGSTRVMGFLQAQILAGNSDYGVHGLPESRVSGMEMGEVGVDVPGLELGVGDREVSARFSGGGGEVQPMDVSASGGGSISQRPRRRKDDVDKRRVIMPAPRMGNTEIPPEDGYTWRKYGQKEILGSRFPRSYYRCTHQKLYNCPAKKQVQRLDSDPYTFEVIYRSDHVCHMSSTAPSTAPPFSAQNFPPLITPGATTTQSPPPPPTSVSLHRWLSMDISCGEGPSAAFADHMRRDFGLGSGAATSSGSSNSMAGSGSAGPSAVRYGIDIDYQLPVTDLADTMFNLGSSSNNSIDLIFSSIEDKWELGDKKN